MRRWIKINKKKNLKNTRHVNTAAKWLMNDQWIRCSVLCFRLFVCCSSLFILCYAFLLWTNNLVDDAPSMQCWRDGSFSRTPKRAPSYCSLLLDLTILRPNCFVLVDILRGAMALRPISCNTHTNSACIDLFGEMRWIRTNIHRTWNGWGNRSRTCYYC